MDFISFSYVILFAIVFAARLAIGRTKREVPYVVLLVLASALFYAWHIPSFLIILLTSAFIDYVAGRLLGYVERATTQAEQPETRRQLVLSGASGSNGAAVDSTYLHDHLETDADSPSMTKSLRREWWRLGSQPVRVAILVLSLSVNLGLLFVFKYTDFFLATLESACGWMGVEVSLPKLEFVLPMGISFYTFASLSYTIDIYRREIRPVKRFWEFFFFVGFFPHLVAGPIVRAANFLPQMARKRRLWLKVFNHGAFLIVRGFFLKMVCADNLAPYLRDVWPTGYTSGADSGRLLLASILFAGQIFFDFEGYCSIAQGTAYLLGYRLPANFNNPYLATSFKNFWERWHITLSQWLRDYLYIPLGGNRYSQVRTYVNLLLVMVLGGLWHGAAFTFLAWGALHGLALAVERLTRMHQSAGVASRLPVRLVWFFIVQATVLAAWIFFRCDSLGNAVQFFRNIAACRFHLLPRTDLVYLCFLVPLLVMHLRGYCVEQGWLARSGATEKSVLAGAMLFAILVCNGSGDVFIYFQF